MEPESLTRADKNEGYTQSNGENLRCSQQDLSTISLVRVELEKRQRDASRSAILRFYHSPNHGRGALKQLLAESLIQTAPLPLS